LNVLLHRVFGLAGRGDKFSSARRVGRYTLILALTLVATLRQASGADIVVTSKSDSGSGSLREALQNVSTGGTITFDAALNGQTILLTTLPLFVTKSVTITGPGADKLTVNQISGNSNVIEVFGSTTNATISGLKITGGNAGNLGGGIEVDDGTLNLVGMEITGNFTNHSGGGVHSFAGSTLNISNSTIANNLALEQGGGVFFEGPGTIVNSSISGKSGNGKWLRRHRRSRRYSRLGHDHRCDREQLHDHKQQQQ
jgi:hypothetical protein